MNYTVYFRAIIVGRNLNIDWSINMQCRGIVVATPVPDLIYTVFKSSVVIVDAIGAADTHLDLFNNLEFVVSSPFPPATLRLFDLVSIMDFKLFPYLYFADLEPETMTNYENNPTTLKHSFNLVDFNPTTANITDTVSNTPFAIRAEVKMKPNFGSFSLDFENTQSNPKFDLEKTGFNRQLEGSVITMWLMLRRLTNPPPQRVLFNNVSSW